MDRYKLSPGKVERVEIKDPDKDVIEITKQILDQHDQILKMNSELLLLLSRPPIIIHPDDKDVWKEEDK